MKIALIVLLYVNLCAAKELPERRKLIEDFSKYDFCALYNYQKDTIKNNQLVNPVYIYWGSAQAASRNLVLSDDYIKKSNKSLKILAIVDNETTNTIFLTFNITRKIEVSVDGVINHTFESFEEFTIFFKGIGKEIQRWYPVDEGKL